MVRGQIRESLEHCGKYFRYYSVLKSCWQVLRREVTKQKKKGRNNQRNNSRKFPKAELHEFPD